MRGIGELKSFGGEVVWRIAGRGAGLDTGRGGLGLVRVGWLG